MPPFCEIVRVSVPEKDAWPAQLGLGTPRHKPHGCVSALSLLADQTSAAGEAPLATLTLCPRLARRDQLACVKGASFRYPRFPATTQQAAVTALPKTSAGPARPLHRDHCGEPRVRDWWSEARDHLQPRHRPARAASLPARSPARADAVGRRLLGLPQKRGWRATPSADRAPDARALGGAPPARCAPGGARREHS